MAFSLSRVFSRRQLQQTHSIARSHTRDNDALRRGPGAGRLVVASVGRTAPSGGRESVKPRQGPSTVNQRRRPSSILGGRGSSSGNHPLGGDQSAPAAAAAAGPGYLGCAWMEP